MKSMRMTRDRLRIPKPGVISVVPCQGWAEVWTIMRFFRWEELRETESCKDSVAQETPLTQRLVEPGQIGCTAALNRENDKLWHLVAVQTGNCGFHSGEMVS